MANITLILLLPFLLSCGGFRDKGIAEAGHHNTLQFDSSKTAILRFAPGRYNPFDHAVTPATLTQEDLNVIDSLLAACVADYNQAQESDDFRIDLKKGNYRKQIMAAIHPNGDKVVWVNCFCGDEHLEHWKTRVLMVHDGGNCYFNLKIKLTTKQFYDLQVNGDA